MLTELDKSFLQRIAEEDGMVEALKKEFETSFLKYLPMVVAETDETIGQKFRAFDTAKRIINNVLDDLVKYKGRKSNENNLNLER